MCSVVFLDIQLGGIAPATEGERATRCCGLIVASVGVPANVVVGGGSRDGVAVVVAGDGGNGTGGPTARSGDVAPCEDAAAIGSSNDGGNIVDDDNGDFVVPIPPGDVVYILFVESE